MAAKRKPAIPPPTAGELDLGDGRDELNLAEFPLSLISKKATEDEKVLVFEDTVFDSATGKIIPRRVTISGSADCGLPSAADEEVLLALIQVSRQQGFKEKKVYFSRYQLLQILGWEDTGYYYNRIVSALNTWLGVNVKWQNAWRDYSRQSSWGSRGIVLIQDFELKKRDQMDSSSYITWADQLFESFQAGNLKGLDFGLYRALRNSIAKRMFRFLDKRFHQRSTLVFDLATFAYEKIGMKRSYLLPNIKQQFRSAIRELEETGFLEPMSERQRYRKRRAGEWDIIFIRARRENGASLAPQGMEFDTLPEIEQDLVRRGVSRGRAKNLAARFPEEAIREKIEEFDFLMAQAAEKKLEPPANPGGYLAQSIEENYAAPKGYKSKAERAREEEEKKAAEAGKRLARRRKEVEEAAERREKEERHRRNEERVRRYLESLSPAKRKQLETEALRASPFGEEPGGLFRQAVIFNYVLEKLENERIDAET